MIYLATFSSATQLHGATAKGKGKSIVSRPSSVRCMAELGSISSEPEFFRTYHSDPLLPKERHELHQNGGRAQVRLSNAASHGELRNRRTCGDFVASLSRIWK